jgi:hypothetical protein
VKNEGMRYDLVDKCTYGLMNGCMMDAYMCARVEANVSKWMDE